MAMQGLWAALVSGCQYATAAASCALCRRVRATATATATPAPEGTSGYVALADGPAAGSVTETSGPRTPPRVRSAPGFSSAAPSAAIVVTSEESPSSGNPSPVRGATNRTASGGETITLEAPHAGIIAAELAHQVGVPDVYRSIRFPREFTADPAARLTFTAPPGFGFPEDLAVVLGDTVKGLNNRIEPEKTPSACHSAVSKVLYGGAKALAIIYGLNFGLMVFSITGSLSENPVIRGVEYGLLGLLALFSTLVNYLQADSAILTLFPDLHQKLCKTYEKIGMPKKYMALATAAILATLFYALTLPAAALMSETVRRGFLTLKGTPSDVQTSKSADYYITEVLHQLARAYFLTSTLITISDTAEKQYRMSRGSKLAYALLPISIIMGGIYGYLTSEKTGTGNSNSLLEVMYPANQIIRSCFTYAGTFANSVVAAKLLVSGGVSLLQSRSRMHGTAGVLSLVACGASLATGLAAGISNFAGGATRDNVISGVVLVFNLMYAAVANYPFLETATEAQRLVNSRQKLKLLIAVMEQINTIAAPGDAKTQVLECLEEIKAKFEAAIKEAELSFGCKNIVARLTCRHPKPDNRRSRVLQRAQSAGQELAALVADSDSEPESETITVVRAVAGVGTHFKGQYQILIREFITQLKAELIRNGMPTDRMVIFAGINPILEGEFNWNTLTERLSQIHKMLPNEVKEWFEKGLGILGFEATTGSSVMYRISAVLNEHLNTTDTPRSGAYIANVQARLTELNVERNGATGETTRRTDSVVLTGSARSGASVVFAPDTERAAGTGLSLRDPLLGGVIAP